MAQRNTNYLCIIGCIIMCVCTHQNVIYGWIREILDWFLWLHCKKNTAVRNYEFSDLLNDLCIVSCFCVHYFIFEACFFFWRVTPAWVFLWLWDLFSQSLLSVCSALWLIPPFSITKFSCILIPNFFFIVTATKCLFVLFKGLESLLWRRYRVDLWWTSGQVGDSLGFSI